MEKLEKLITQMILEKDESERIQKYIERLNTKLNKLKIEIEELKARYIEEFEDVEKIENSNWNGLFKQFLGHDDKALEHEKQEMLWAYMSLEKAHKTMEVLQYEKSVLVQKLVKFDYDEEKLTELLKQKEDFLKASPQMRIKLTLLDHKLEHFNKQKKEIMEVLELNAELASLFRAVKNELGQISNWNKALSSYYGRGHYSSYKKKQYIKRNLELIPKIEILNEKLNIELQDLKKKYELDFTNNLTLLNNFFVLFLDNLITDWIVRDGLLSATKTVDMCHAKVERLELMLKHELEQVVKALRALNVERENAVFKGKLN